MGRKARLKRERRTADEIRQLVDAGVLSGSGRVLKALAKAARKGGKNDK